MRLLAEFSSLCNLGAMGRVLLRYLLLHLIGLGLLWENALAPPKTPQLEQLCGWRWCEGCRWTSLDRRAGRKAVRCEVVWGRWVIALSNLEGTDWVTTWWGACSLECCITISMEQWHEAQAARVCINTSYWPIGGNYLLSWKQVKKLARLSDLLQMIPFWFSHRFWWRSLQGGVVSKTIERKSKRQGSPRGRV